MFNKDYNHIISQRLNLTTEQVGNTISLLEAGATVPFISRYRKESTGSLNEVQIEEIRDLYNKLIEIDKRRAAVLDSITEQGKLTDILKERILAAESLAVLEDLYLPYRPKRKTRASVAREKGLEPLAKMIVKQIPGRNIFPKTKNFLPLMMCLPVRATLWLNCIAKTPISVLG